MSSSNPTTDSELENILTEVERSLVELQQRHAQVKRDLRERSRLLSRQQELQQQESNFAKEPIKTELHHLQKELDRLDLNLESSLLPDIFWQVVRFVFFGIIIGWFLHSWI
jgi:protein subunit release factor A